jgi:hypothetical protein
MIYSHVVGFEDPDNRTLRFTLQTFDSVCLILPRGLSSQSHLSSPDISHADAYGDIATPVGALHPHYCPLRPHSSCLI